LPEAPEGTKLCLRNVHPVLHFSHIIAIALLFAAKIDKRVHIVNHFAFYAHFGELIIRSFAL
jgi:hypothetical protein